MKRTLIVIAAGLLAAGCGSGATPATPMTTATTAPKTSVTAPSTARTTTTQPTSTPASTTTKPPAAPYPPKNPAEFKAFAQTGNPTAIHAFASDSKGTKSCPTPNLYGTADPGITGRQLQADESAFFVQRGLADQPCSAFLFLFNSPTEDQSGGYTVGRVAIDGTTSDSTRNLEVDTSNPADSFNFNF